MPPHRQPRLIPLHEAARLTSRTPADLRRWCATGRLRCERVGSDWLLLESDLHVAAALREVDETARERAVLSIAFPDETDGRRAHERLVERFGLGPADLGIAPLALDGADLVLVAGVFPAESIDEVVDLAHAMGGVVVDGIDERRITPSPGPRRTQQGESSYG